VKQIRKRLTYANVMSSIAVFLVLGGATALAAGLAKNSVGSKQLKKNSVTAAKIKKNAVTGAKIKANAVNGSKVADGSLTGADINLGTLGTVPNATNATRAASAAAVDSVLPFSAGAGVHQFVTLAQTANFELKGWCDPEETQFAPGLESERVGTVMILVNRGSAAAFGDSSDDSNYRMETGQEIGFNYEDNGDGGLAQSTDGHFMAVPSWGNEVSDTGWIEGPPGHSYPFSSACHFAGAVLVG
jgi:hypothetical protein